MELSANLRLVFQPNGTLCLLGLNTPIANQTAGGLVGTSAGGTDPAAWSVSCEDSSGATFNLITDLPPTGSSPYSDVALAADGSLLFTGRAGSLLATTPGVVQPKFGGIGPYNYDAPINAIPQGDAFLMRVSLNNPLPDIELISPNFIVLDNGNSAPCTPLLMGTGFAYGATITVNGHAATGTFVDSGQTTLSFPCSELQAGANEIVMTLPAPGGGSSKQVLTALNAPPSTVTVTPASVTQGAGETKLIITATNLSAGSVLYWNGSPRTASFVLNGVGTNTGHFVLLLQPSDLSQPSTAKITVSNPGPGGGISAPISFIVQPASGPGIPVLSTPEPFTYGGGYTLGPLVQLDGLGFAANTTAFWDGAQIPVTSFTSTQITIQPPAADLTHLGAHQVYAANGSFQSLPVPIYIARMVVSEFSTYDPVQKRLYVLGSSELYSTTTSLLVLDATTGNLLKSISNIVVEPQAIALSGNGQYVYIAGLGTGPLAHVLRYNAATGAVDLQWPIPAPAGQTMSSVNSLVTPPDSPQTVMVSTSAGDVLVYDGNQPRQYDSASAGFSPSSVASEGGYRDFFASATRIYAVPQGSSLTGNAPCWIWFNYDAFGISGGQQTCAAPPPEIQQDSGVTYLTDGTRTYIVSLPAEQSPGYATTILAFDLATRDAWQFDAPLGGGYQLFDYQMSAQQLQVQAEISQIPYPGNAALYSVGNGQVLLLVASEMILVPAVPTTAQPDSRPAGLHFHPRQPGTEPLR